MVRCMSHAVSPSMSWQIGMIGKTIPIEGYLYTVFVPSARRGKAASIQVNEMTLQKGGLGWH